MNILPTDSLRNNPICTQGMVTSPHYLASGTGLNILRRGGNALESAIATGLSLAVVYPHMCTLGGDAFWLIYTACDRTLRALNASGRAGHAASPERYAQMGFRHLPPRGILSANTVPGLISGMMEVRKLSQEKLGGSMSWDDLASDAIVQAEDGIPASTSFVRMSQRALARNVKDPASFPISEEFARCFLNQGRAFALGERMRQPNLAASLKTLVSEGPESFYTGSIAKIITRALKKEDGLLDDSDFAEHSADWVTPLVLPYRGYLACNTPPNSQGLASLAILNILSNFDLDSIGSGADYYHLLVEATKEAFLDRDKVLSDPDFVRIPTVRLLSKSHGKAQAMRITRTARPSKKLLAPGGDTAWFGVVDKFGNAVSCIQSIFYDFGSCFVAEGTGILLQNRGSFFSLDPTHVNVLAPRKRTFHTLNPAMLLKNGVPYLVYGSMGGEGQPQTQAALVTHVLHHGMTPAEACTAPRWLYGRSFGEEAHNILTLEARITEDIQKELKRRGHCVRITHDYDDLMGHAGMICVDPVRNCLMGASDPRGDGLAAGF